LTIEVVETTAEVRTHVRGWHRSGQRIGLVPTMGALHEGHLALVRRSVAENDVTVVSIFVNPLQFGPSEDLASYPRDLAGDCQRVEEAGAALVFAPSVDRMYAPDHSSYVVVERLTRALCGESRPGHFRGVTTVVTKLLHAVDPDRAYFGQKDAQQARVIRRMVRDLDFDLEVVILPTVRDADGLALSSRNRYLSPSDRGQALALSRALGEIGRAFAAGERSAAALRQRGESILAAFPRVRLDYLEIVDDESLEPLERIEGPALVAVAAFVGTTRLIDNVVLGDSHIVSS